MRYTQKKLDFGLVVEFHSIIIARNLETTSILKQKHISAFTFMVMQDECGGCLVVVSISLSSLRVLKEVYIMIIIKKL